MRSSGKGGEVVDATVEVGVGGLESLVGVGPGRVGYRPVQPGQGRIEFLVGVVTDRDDQVGVGEPGVQTGRDGLGRGPVRAVVRSVTARGWTAFAGWVPAEVAGRRR